MRMKSSLFLLVSSLTAVSSTALAASEADGRTEQSMDQILAQADTATTGTAQPQMAADQGMDPRRERLQLGGDSAVTSGTQFNPAISVILDGVYATFNDEVDDPAGFGEAGGHDHGHGHSHGIEEGFQLREAEVTFEGPIDPYFDMFVTAAITESEIELEEAFIETRALPAGFKLKGGKFLSDVGYINRQHPHDWDFVDQPWMREFIFSDEGLNETGIQATWVAPTRNYTLFGVEILEGETPGVANHIGDEEPGLHGVTGPRLITGFANYAPNLGYDHALQLGLSGGFTDAYQEREEHSHDGEIEIETLSGDSWFAGVDAVYKYNGQGSMGEGDFKLQGEYFVRARDLTFREFERHGDHYDLEEKSSIHPRQDGAYVQALYGFAPRWDAGLRVDGLGMTNKAFDGDGPEDASTSLRYTGQVSYSPTEFSRLRVQVAQLDLHSVHDEGDGHGHDHGHGGATDSWQLMLQFNMSLGAHGAHAF